MLGLVGSRRVAAPVPAQEADQGHVHDDPQGRDDRDRRPQRRHRDRRHARRAQARSRPRLPGGRAARRLRAEDRGRAAAAGRQPVTFELAGAHRDASSSIRSPPARRSRSTASRRHDAADAHRRCRPARRCSSRIKKTGYHDATSTLDVPGPGKEVRMVHAARGLRRARADQARRRTRSARRSSRTVSCSPASDARRGARRGRQAAALHAHAAEHVAGADRPVHARSRRDRHHEDRQARRRAAAQARSRPTRRQGHGHAARRTARTSRRLPSASLAPGTYTVDFNAPPTQAHAPGHGRQPRRRPRSSSSASSRRRRAST